MIKFQLRSFTLATWIFLQTSFANYTGIWTGTGTLTSTHGYTWNCDNITLIVDHHSEAFRFGRFQYSCGDLSFSFVPPELQIQSQNAFWKDQKIGKFSKTKIDFLFRLQNEGDFAKYTVRRKGNTLDYQDQQITPERTLTLKAILTLKEVQ